MGRKCCFHSQRATLHVPALRYTVSVRTCTYAYSAGDTNSYAVHGMEQDSESERLRKRQATTPHRPVKTSRLLEARRCTLASTRSCCSLLISLAKPRLHSPCVKACFARRVFYENKSTGHHHLRIGPYKGSVNSVQNQMSFNAIVQMRTVSHMRALYPYTSVKYL